MKNLLIALTTLTIGTTTGNLSCILDTTSQKTESDKIESQNYKNNISEIDNISFHKYNYDKKPVSFIWYYQVMFKDETLSKINEIYKTKNKKDTIYF